ncbi:hypothetical protein DL95DRAFT_427438 [Leptodontidium sp. 2 PMI_412]|nr:hypothetical protein DL95DRAFT_427438 [Leptodontidium sp. 2 PMI_412]
MAPSNDISSPATCTTCTFSEDFSNYWTAVLYFRARNGTFKRVPQIENQLFGDANGGVTVYYLSGKNKDTAFKKGFRMITGDPRIRTSSEAQKYRQLTYICLQTPGTRNGETKNMPTKPCPRTSSTGFGNHGDYVFGWKGDALQKAIDSTNCNVNCSVLKRQTIQVGNKCTQNQNVTEEIDGCGLSIPFPLSNSLVTSSV